ncbi:MAG: hypothetical protein HY918_00260 [Candidatus Doudnabacteria bacterium]|nr:hypothetical protein [Candidatus Doudnabacteria bacterium]
MIKFLLLDCDGLIIKRDKYFSQRLSSEKNIKLDLNKIKDFFEGVFLLCEIGEKDLKEELAKVISDWGWPGTLEEMLEFWFSGEKALDNEIVEYIQNLRLKGIKVYVATDQEKYRTNYLWNEAGLKNFLDGMLSSADIGFLKNDINFWAEVSKILPAHKKDEILFWDHELHKIDAAKSFGYLTEMYSGPEEFKELMKKYL